MIGLTTPQTPKNGARTEPIPLPATLWGAKLDTDCRRYERGVGSGEERQVG